MHNLFSNSLSIDTVTQPSAPLNLSCHKLLNETTGNIAFVAIWEIKSENLSLQERTLEAIDHYDVTIFVGERLTAGLPLLSESITHGVRCNEKMFSSRTRDGYTVGVAYCIKNNVGDLQVIGLRPDNNPNIQYRLRVSVFLVLQRWSSRPVFIFAAVSYQKPDLVLEKNS